ncbi:hypothetical protein IYW40_02260 [Methylocystis sp. H4A]|uniref:hypothetical protein n=1 Tax=Methylocystis sp. H4A TaxID=2785788 RepID=UPI0018C2E011|nr:hypothetical protein [Methylocystis sp. H4A]MBG0800325.1 hypothetical protein [Methylocystis sp. H4A]
MTTAPTVGFRAELFCSALSRCLLSFWSRSRHPRSWVSLARCSEGFASDLIGAITAAIIVRGPTTRVIADTYMSRIVTVMAAAVAEGTAAVLAAADNSAKAGFNGSPASAGRVAA